MIVCAVTKNGKSPADNWIRNLKKKDPKESARLVALFKNMARTGEVRDPRKFKKERGDVYAFKRSQYRVPCYQDGSCWVLTHGFKKQERRWRQEELDKGERIMKEDKSRNK